MVTAPPTRVRHRDGKTASHRGPPAMACLRPDPSRCESRFRPHLRGGGWTRARCHRGGCALPRASWADGGAAWPRSCPRSTRSGSAMPTGGTATTSAPGSRRHSRSAERTHLRARAWRSGLRTTSAGLFEQVDLLATPTCGIARKVIGQDLVEVSSGQVHHRPPLSWFSSLVNALGVPAIAIPLRGLAGDPPPSLQLIGPPWSERLLLAAAASLEEAGIAGFRPPQGW